jgi:hypothetical protein
MGDSGGEAKHDTQPSVVSILADIRTQIETAPMIADQEPSPNNLRRRTH